MRIHYLGHASFVLRFENGESILLDYGVSNSYGLASPVFDVSGAEPSIVAFSHDHPDHRRPGALFPKSRHLTGGGNLTLDGLTIRSIPTSEASIAEADNVSFEITYQGFRILHLADAQAFISAIDDPAVKRQVKARYPDSYDLVFMTIDGLSEMTPQAATFLDLLAPARAIPMHYWNRETKADFLTEVARLNRTGRGEADRYTIAETDCSDFSLYADAPPQGTMVLSLEPSPLYLPPSAARPLERVAAAEPYANTTPEPCEPDIAAASAPPHRRLPGVSPVHRPAAAQAAGRATPGAGSSPSRRPAPATSPSRDRARVSAHLERDFG